MKHLLSAILLLLPGLALSQTPLKSGGVTKLVPGPGSRVSRQEVTNGIVGWWKLNEGTGTTANDSSGNVNTGTLVGPTWTNALYGGLLALAFDGSDDYVDVGNASSLTGTGALSVAAWVKFTGTGDYTIASRTLFTLNNCVWDLETFSGNVYFGITSNGTAWSKQISTPSTYNNGLWHHVVAVYTPSTTVEIFIDGLSAVSNASSIPSALFTSSIPVNIGRVEVPDNYFLGSLDDIRIYNRALSLNEIQLMFTNNPNNTP